MPELGKRGDSVVILVLSGSRGSSHQKKGIKVSFPLFPCLVLMFEGNVGVEVNLRVGIMEVELCSLGMKCLLCGKCSLDAKERSLEATRSVECVLCMWKE